MPCWTLFVVKTGPKYREIATSRAGIGVLERLDRPCHTLVLTVKTILWYPKRVRWQSEKNRPVSTADNGEHKANPSA
jgi:hypothetical protein